MSAEAGVAFVRIKGDFSGLNREVNAAVSPLAQKFGGRFGKAMGPVMAQQSKHLDTFTRAAKYATVGAAGLAAYGFKSVVETGAQFEKQMSTNAAVSEANRRQMALLEKQSIKLGKATFYSANEVAEAQAELIKGGLSLQQVLGGGLPAALSLAEAGQLDLATAAETTVNAMKLFGLEGREASSVADMLSTAANRTTADVLDFAMGLKQGGSVAKLAGLDLNETVTVLEALAEAGIKNADAGTSLKSFFINIGTPSKKAKKMMEELGLTIFKQNGQLKSLPAIAENLRKAFGDVSKAQFLEKAGTIAGSDAIRTLYSLYDQGPEKLRALERANAKQGTAQEIAAKKMDNFSGLWEQFKGSLETTEIQIYKGMAPALEGLAEEATKAANRVGTIFENPNLSGSEKMERAVDVLGREIGGIWERNHVTEHLVDTMDRAIPAIAEHAGHLGFEAVKGFGKGFLHADPLGKAVMATWAINFIGGRAAFVGVGRFFGLSLGKEIATTAATTVAADMAASSAATGVLSSGASRWLGTEGSKAAFMRAQNLTIPTTERAALAAQGGVFGSIVGGAAGKSAGGRFAGSVGAALRSVQWGRIGGIGLGIALADNMLTEFERRSNENSPDVNKALDSIGGKQDLVSFGREQILGPFINPLFGDKDVHSEKDAAQNLKAQYDELLHKRVKLSAATQADLRSQLRGLHLNKQARSELERMLAVTRAGSKLHARVDLGMDPKRLSEISHGFNFLKRGIGTNMADINRVTKRTGRLIATEFGSNTKEGRQLAAKNMRATAHAIEVEMDHSGDKTKAGMKRIRELIRNADLMDPSRKQAQDFGKEWAKGLEGSKEATRKGIKAMIAEAQKMPAPMRKAAIEAAFEQAKAMKRGGNLSADAVRTMRSRVLSEWGSLKLGGKLQSKGLADGVIGNVSRMVNTTGAALSVFGDNVSGALKSFGVKWQKFEIQVAGGAATQNRQLGGFIVPGSGDGDKFRTALPPNSFILNREATAAYGFMRGGLMPVALEPGERAFMPHEVKAAGGPRALEAMNRAVPRFQKGGALGGIHEPNIAGPDPLRALGQNAIHKVFEGGEAYLKKHMGPRPGLGALDGKPVSEWIIPILEWARQHGWGGAVTSGYRTPNEQLAAAAGYGLQHYGAAGPLGSNHVKINYPGGAVDVSAAAQLAAILKGYPGKPNLVWGGPVMGDYVHFSATGHQRGGLVQALIKGGGVLSPFEWGQAMLRGGFPPKQGVIAGGLGTIKSESNFDASQQGQGPSGHIGGWAESPAFGSVAARLDPIRSSAAAFKEWQKDGGFWQAWGQWEAQQSGLSGGGAGAYGPEYMDTAKKVIEAGGGDTNAHSFKEDVPATYHGCRTGSLDIPSSMPKSLSGVESELRRRRNEIAKYRSAAARAEKEHKPAIAQALQKNVTALSTRIAQLSQERHKLRFERAKKKLSRGLSKRLGRVMGYETDIERFQRDYSIANQTAEQVVGLEPTQSELPASASDAERQAAEKKYVEDFKAYVDGQERPAYADVLSKEATWRNAILRAEYFGFGEGKPSVAKTERNWEKKIREAVASIDHINDFTAKVGKDVSAWKGDPDHKGKDLPKWITDEIKKRDELRDKLPMLRFEDREFRKVLGEARAEFYPGFKDALSPPVTPLEGSGTLEDHLAEVQGIHWPDQHALLAALPDKRAKGMFGGAIWETQEAIEELGLKINQAAAGLGGGAGGGGDSTLKDLEQEIALKANQRTAVSEAQKVALEGWDQMRQGFLANLPRFHDGGRVTSSALSPHGDEVPIMAKVGESVLTAEETNALARNGGVSGAPIIEEMHIYPDGRVRMRYEGQEFETAVRRVVQKTPGRGLTTPGGARR